MSQLARDLADELAPGEDGLGGDLEVEIPAIDNDDGAPVMVVLTNDDMERAEVAEQVVVEIVGEE